MQHDWHLIDADDETECRRLDEDHYQLRDKAGTITDLTAAEFDRWRAGEAGDGGS